MNRIWWAVVGLITVAFGSVVFVERIGGISEVAEIARRWWPLVLVGLGLMNLFRSSDRRWAVVGPLLTVGAGGILLLYRFDIVPGAVYPRAWPAALVLAGTALVLAATMPDHDDLPERGDLRRFVWLRGERLESRARSFWYAHIVVVAGSFTLDLSHAKLHKQTYMHVTVLFGAVEIALNGNVEATIRRPFVIGIRGFVPGDPPMVEMQRQVVVSVLGLFGDATMRSTEAIPQVVSVSTPPSLPSGGAD